MEWENIQFAYETAKSQSDLKQSEFYDLCIQFPIKGFDILSLRQTLDDRIEWLESGKRLAGRLNKKLEATICKGLLANALRHRGNKTDQHKARVNLESAIHASASTAEEKKWLGFYLNILGNLHADMGEFCSADQCFLKAQNLFQEISNNVGVSIALINQARALINVGKTIQAHAICNRALGIIDNTTLDIRRRGGVFCNLGQVYRHLGDIRESITYHEKALRIFRELGDQLWEGISYCLLGRAKMDLSRDEVKEGMCLTERALNIFSELGEHRWVCHSKGNLGVGCIKLEQYREAKVHLDEALRIAEETGDERGKGIHWNYLGKVHFNQKHYQEAINANEYAYSLALLVGDGRRKAAATLSLGHNYYALGDYTDAEEYFNLCVQFSEEVGDKKKLSKAYHGLALVKEKEGNIDEAKTFTKLARQETMACND
mgnify:CR=1 FL=1